MKTCKIGYDFPNKIKESGLGYMEHDYMHVKGHKRSHGTSSNLKVMAES